MKETDFEAWAQLLIRRKLPDRYQHLINSEVVQRGATILKSGEAFEIHVEGEAESATRESTAYILVTPLPPVHRALSA